ncbi:MAG: hypothetical protein VBE63_22290 [Lamprobacter sp.]|uniref:hypothetical protein n=1 Tax=Lamprobacter sp. TaxID=3100796 RepID=UPI002B25EFFA|nr:hypothetical protein [Lamprobacter sp.]MEA3642647.1 hypothetical protein [Lamprobacter sp.]
MDDAVFWMTMAALYAVGYHVRGLRRLRQHTAQEWADCSPTAPIWVQAFDRRLLASTVRCVALSMGALVGIQIVDSESTEA